MKFIPPISKEEITDPALIEKWGAYPFDLAMFHVWGHTPAEFVTFTTFNRQVWTEQEGGVELLLKEMAVVYTAVLVNSSYEWHAHGRMIAHRGGSQDQVDAIIEGDVESDLFDDRQKLMFRFTREVVQNHNASEETRAAMKAEFSIQQILELTWGIGCYINNSIFGNLGDLVAGDDAQYN